jgi:hypothetical protein
MDSGMHAVGLATVIGDGRRGLDLRRVAPDEVSGEHASSVGAHAVDEQL